jgi:hypothetical protein
VTTRPICLDCAHFDQAEAIRSGKYRCKAFPLEIPQTILVNNADHKKPYPGDNGIRFEPIRPGGTGVGQGISGSSAADTGRRNPVT